MILLFTDFGPTALYTGQVLARLAEDAPGVAAINLVDDAPADLECAAHLLAALAGRLPRDCVVVAVIDPGVGGPRRALLVEADGRRYVGPDNGLFAVLRARAGQGACREILWRPPRLSASFHGRDLFAPVAARLARGLAVALGAPDAPAPDAAAVAALARVIYVDGYGNCLTGIPAAELATGAALAVAGRRLPRVRTFGDVAAGEPMCYENSLGLLEIAVNGGSAADRLGLAPGAAVTLLDG